MSRKYVFYLKDFARGLVITDYSNDKPIDQDVETLKKSMDSVNGTCRFETEKDRLIIKSDQIVAIHIILDELTESNGSNIISKKSKNKNRLDSVEGISKSIPPELDLEDIIPKNSEPIIVKKEEPIKIEEKSIKESNDLDGVSLEDVKNIIDSGEKLDG